MEGRCPAGEGRRVRAVHREGIVREAFSAAGEHHYLLSKLFYTGIFGRRWEVALVGFAYLKCLDNAVDEEPDAAEAFAVLASQRALIARAYAGGCVDEGAAALERYAQYFIRYDRTHGVWWRALLERILETMDFDVHRRFVAVPRETLDAYVLKLGEAVIRYTTNFLAPDYPLHESFIRSASRAYLYADALIDLEHDLRFGVINVPSEDIASWHLDVAAPNARLCDWQASQAPRVFGFFAEALDEVKRLVGRRARWLGQLFLRRKRQQLARFLRRRAAVVTP